MSIITALRRLYINLQASAVVWQGEESRSFQVQRGVRQGDPLSPLLFNLVMKEVLEEVQVVWKRRGYGTNIGSTLRGERLTHVTFADDMTLIARSLLSMKRMLLMLREALAARGLNLHPSKCKIQTNVKELQIRGQIELKSGFSVEALGADSNMVLLGTLLNLTDATKHEIDNRIASGWKTFWGMKKLLLNQKVSVSRRLRLFDATVGNCVTWCCESWSPRAEELHKLEVARRSMLRKIVDTRRGPEETWVDYILRSTHKALDLSSRAGTREWGRYHYERKWHWAGHVARRAADTWLYKVTTWRDSAWQHLSEEAGVHRELRPSKRRWMKWEDSLRRYTHEKGHAQWTELAQDRAVWEALVDDFINSF